MARPLSDNATKLINYLNATPATLATAAQDLALEYTQAKSMLNRLVYAKAVLVLRKERVPNCKKRVATYVGKDLALRIRQQAMSMQEAA